MKVEIEKDGTLHIYPENNCECFALKNWGKKNEMPGTISDESILPLYKTDQLIIHLEEKSKNESNKSS
jgi:hypothetical protein